MFMPQLNIKYKQCQRLDWVDTARALAIIFVYLGHWTTKRITGFAYAFHLQLFFMISGFFSQRQQTYPPRRFLKKQIITLTIPLFLWAWISFVIKRLDAEQFTILEMRELVLAPSTIQPNYWFWPPICAVCVVYYFVYRIIRGGVGKNFMVFLVIHVLFGETSVLPPEYNIFSMLSHIPFVQIINNWFSIQALPEYGFWYALGAAAFPHIKKWAGLKDANDNRKFLFHMSGILFGFLSSILLLKKVTEFTLLSNFIYKCNFTYIIYKDLCTVVICGSMLYAGILLQKSKALKEIGQNTMIFMGLEFITHGYIALDLLPMINLGIPNIVSSGNVISIVAGQIIINLFLASGIKKFFPILNGNIK